VLEFQELQYEIIDPNRIHLHGMYGVDTLDIVLKDRAQIKRLLEDRGFHWVNEYPLNR